jgi:hypothetical protein
MRKSLEKIPSLYIESTEAKFFKGPGWYYINKFHQIKGPLPTKEAAEAQGHNDNNLSEPI